MRSTIEVCWLSKPEGVPRIALTSAGSFEEVKVPMSQLIVCEKTGKWAAALRRELENPAPRRLFETRLLEHCEEQLVANPCSIVTIEQTWSNYESVFSLLQRMHQQVPAARAIVLDETRDSRLLRLNQIAGAIHVTQSRLHLRHAARLVMRHLSKYPATLSHYDELISRLPWGD